MPAPLRVSFATMLRRFTAVSLVLLAGCGARSNLQPSESDPATGGPTTTTGDGGGTTSTTSTSTTTTVTTAPLPITPQSIIEACVIATSCGRAPDWLFDDTAATCIDGFSRLEWSYDSPPLLPDPVIADKLLACAASARGDCEAFQSCFGGDWVTLPRCREGGFCSNNIMSASTEGPSYDCGAIGATCQDLWSGAQRACCNPAPCSTSTGVECDGTVASFCGIWGENIVFDCGQSGRTCQSDPLEPCVGTLGPCAPDTTATCAGNTVTYCSAGRLATYDCSSTMFRTACNQGAPPYETPCRPQGAECDPWNTPGTCDGSVLRTCADGVRVDVDCAALGFSGCEAAPDIARCTE